MTNRAPGATAHPGPPHAPDDDDDDDVFGPPAGRHRSAAATAPAAGLIMTVESAGVVPPRSWSRCLHRLVVRLEGKQAPHVTFGRLQPRPSQFARTSASRGGGWLAIFRRMLRMRLIPVMILLTIPSLSTPRLLGSSVSTSLSLMVTLSRRCAHLPTFDISDHLLVGCYGEDFPHGPQ